MMLAEQLKEEEMFSVKDSPIWMDSSTSAQCREIENVLSSSQSSSSSSTMASLTGSVAYERFTASQILKIRQLFPSLYELTGTSFFLSFFLLYSTIP